MKKLLLLCLTCLLLLSEAYGQVDSVGKRKLIIRGDKNYPPYEYFDEDGNITGYDVELTKALMEKLGFDYDIDIIDWDIATEQLKNKEIDMLMGATFSAERADLYNFSSPHCYIHQCFVFPGEPTIKSIEDLFNKEIIVQKGTLIHKVLAESGVTNKLVVVENMKEAFDLLLRGKHDVAICEEPMVLFIKRDSEYNDIQYSVITDMEPGKFCFALRRDDPELVSIINHGLEQLKEDGSYYIIYNKWFNSTVVPQTISLLARTIILSCLLLLALAFIVILISRLRVIRATRKLRILNNELESALRIGKLTAWVYKTKFNAFFPLYGGYLIDKKGTDTASYLDYIHPDHRANFLSSIKSITVGEILEKQMILRYLPQNGTDDERYLETELIMIEGKKHKADYILGVQRDITYEYLYRNILEVSKKKTDYALKVGNMAIWEYDIATKRISTSNDPTSSHGEGSFSAEKHLRYIHPEDHSTMLWAYQFMDNRTNEDFSVEIRMKYNTLSNEYRYMLITGSPLERDAYSIITKYVGFRRDITESKKMINDLIVLKNRAEQSDRLKSAFLANISHEIRTPLNAIVGFSEVLMDCDNEQEKRQYAAVIQQNNDMLLSIIDSIVELSKFESSSIDLYPSQFDLCILLKGISADFEKKTSKKNLSLQCTLPYEASIVFFDKDRITQIVTNLLSNAVKFTEKGTIKLTCQRDIKGITISVSDTGIGIDKKDFQRIFDRFEKLNSMSQGAGIGLSVTKAIVEAMNGTIKVDSSVGKGSTFTVYIPLT